MRGSPLQTSTNPSWSGPGGIQRWSDWGNNVLGNMKKESNVANAIRTREDQQPPVLSNMIKEQPQGNVLSKLQNILVNTPEQIQALDKVKAMAQVAQTHQNSLYQPAGANFKPDMQGYKELLAANQQQTNGYISPLLSALGFTQQQNNNSTNMESTLGNLVKVLQNMQGQS